MHTLIAARRPKPIALTCLAIAKATPGLPKSWAICFLSAKVEWISKNILPTIFSGLSKDIYC